MIRSIGILFVLVFLSQPAQAQLDFNARRDSVLQRFVQPDIGGNYAAATACALSPAERETGYAMFRELASTVSFDAVERYRMTAAYLHLLPGMNDSLKGQIQYIWEHFPVSPSQSEYQRVAYHTAQYLAAATFPEDAAYFNGKSQTENLTESRAYLLHWMDESCRYGQRDFDSPTYGGVFFTAMLLLRDFSNDEEVRRKAELMAQWLLADFAHDHLNGNYCGAHAREQSGGAVHPVSTEMSSISWLYFGDGPRVYAREQLFAALSDFRPHPAIVELATVRSEPFESWERKRPAERLRSGAGTSDEDVIRYTYMTPLYAMGSIPGGLVQPKEQHSWDVTWIASDPRNPATLFLMQPWSEAGALTPFLPHDEELALRMMSARDPYFDTVSKTVGGSPFEDVFQYRNTLIALYDIDDIKRFPVIVGFFPPEVDTMHVDSLGSGWITINTGDVYLGVYPFKPYRLIEGAVATNLITTEKRNGFIVQVAGRNVAGSFKDFQKRIEKTRPDLGDFDSDRRVRYSSMFGDSFDVTFHGARSVNDKTPSMPGDLLFSSPWLSSKRGSGVLTLHATSGDVQLDMNTATISSE